jgi:prepilin-type N-terminal cleavage/methylation domain-containing protein
MNINIKARQGGFTLVEIAIVLVIIGLLLVGVLQGQEMIENGKVKNLANNMKGVSAAYYAYQDRYQAVPGDDVLASTRFTGAVNGGGNGAITGVTQQLPHLLPRREQQLLAAHAHGRTADRRCDRNRGPIRQRTFPWADYLVCSRTYCSRRY